jgi:hypothetical protein
VVGSLDGVSATSIVSVSSQLPKRMWTHRENH